MPPRSNDFQRMIAILETILADGVVVTESKMLTDRISGAQREVDICVEGAIGRRPLIISIECRDHRRPQPVSWVEEMHAKHERLPTNSLILVSSSGFTEQARMIAQSYGHQLIVPEQITQSDVGDIVNAAATIVAQRIQLRNKTIHLGFALQEQFLVCEVPDEFPVQNRAGAEIGTAKMLVREVLGRLTPEQLFDDLDEDAKHFTVRCKNPRMNGDAVFASVPATPAGDAASFRIATAIFTGTAEIYSGDVKLTHGRYNSANFSSGTVTFGGDRAHIVIVEEPLPPE